MRYVCSDLFDALTFARRTLGSFSAVRCRQIKSTVVARSKHLVQEIGCQVDLLSPNNLVSLFNPKILESKR